MAKVNNEYLQALQDAVAYIALNGVDLYTWFHSGDTYYKKIILYLAGSLNKTFPAGWGLPPSTDGWSIDQLCEFFDLTGYIFTELNIPSAYRELYKACFAAYTTMGKISKRTPFKINDANTAKQQAVREIFLKGRDCFKNQMNYTEITNPNIGYKSRGHWFNASVGSGLYYYTYFMQETLKVMFGPLVHDKYPFIGEQTPDWCKACSQAEVWEYTPEITGDFIFAIHELTLPAAGHSYMFNIKAEPDPESATPGDTSVLNIKIGVQSLNEEDEPTGDIVFYYITPMGTEWQSGSYSFTAGPDTKKIYLSIEPTNGDGDYLLLFRSSQIENTVSDLEYLIYGAEGNPFNWQVGSGIFSFKEFRDI